MDKVYLDGEWDFCLDEKYGIVSFPETYGQKINVPYQVESTLSGVAYGGDVRQCWYKKEVGGISCTQGKRLLLHIGACDYKTLVFVNKKLVTTHVGGYTPIEADVTEEWQANNVIEICVQDDMRDWKASGKQSKTGNPYGCFYTRTTGIWQSVYLEKREEKRVTKVKFYPDIHTPAVTVALETNVSDEANVEVFYEGRLCGSACGSINYKGELTCPLSEKHLWEIGNGRMYDVVITFGADRQRHKFGLREVKYDGYKFLLNGKSVFQRLVLDQGYYGDGIYTPASPKEFEKDILRALELGFNGARLHQKVFEPVYLEIADRCGFMVWGEYPSWGIDYTDITYLGTFLSEWKETLDRDFNHPSVVTWCPLNEVWTNTTKGNSQPDLRFVDGVYEFTKAYDTTRPCVDVSGGYHGKKTDLFDFHCYESAGILKAALDGLDEKDELEVKLLYGSESHCYPQGKPVNVSEFGGIAMIKKSSVSSVNEDAVQSTSAWGYGEGEGSSAELVGRINELVDVILDSPKISGFCYTQLYDVMQEQNGLFSYNREDKLTQEDKASLRKHMMKKAAIEEE